MAQGHLVCILTLSLYIYIYLYFEALTSGTFEGLFLPKLANS